MKKNRKSINLDPTESESKKSEIKITIKRFNLKKKKQSINFINSNNRKPSKIIRSKACKDILFFFFNFLSHFVDLCESFRSAPIQSNCHPFLIESHWCSLQIFASNFYSLFFFFHCNLSCLAKKMFRISNSNLNLLILFALSIYLFICLFLD